jgi:hypothetical protein
LDTTWVLQRVHLVGKVDGYSSVVTTSETKDVLGRDVFL